MPFELLLLCYLLGISLPADQWEKLKTLVNQVDKDLKKSKWNLFWLSHITTRHSTVEFSQMLKQKNSRQLYT